MKVIGALATLHDKRVTDDLEILGLLKLLSAMMEEYRGSHAAKLAEYEKVKK